MADIPMEDDLQRRPDNKETGMKPPKRRPNLAPGRADPPAEEPELRAAHNVEIPLDQQVRTEPRPSKRTRSGKTSGKRTGPEILNDFAGVTSRVVQKAACILEEEIAAGIIAAKQVEERFLNVSELRSTGQDEVVQRFRRDSHEVVDLLLDMVTLATKSVGDFAQRLVTIRTDQRADRSSAAAPGGIPTLKLPGAIRPGGSVAAPMSMENGSANATGEFEFHSTDLVSAAGNRISAQQILFTPHTLDIGPNGAEQVIVTVVAPEDAVPGTYAGLMQATKLDQLRVVLVLNVE